MLGKIEEMLAELLPSDNGKPDISGTGSPDIARLVLNTRDCSDTVTLQNFFNHRSGEEGWYEIADLLARALVSVDKEHRKIIDLIQRARSNV